MPLKHLEHEGNEDFGAVLNRTAIKEEKRKLKVRHEDLKSDRLEKRQAKYFNSENPALWDGEI